MELITLAVPFVTTLVMSFIKLLAGMNIVGNPGRTHPMLRATLIVFSALGVVATAWLTGNAVDPNNISELVKALIETLVTAYLSHSVYKATTAAY